MHGASAVFVVKNGNGTACIMADFSATFLTSYDTKSGPQVGEPGPRTPLCARTGPAPRHACVLRVAYCGAPCCLGALCTLRLQSHRRREHCFRCFILSLFQFSSRLYFIARTQRCIVSAALSARPSPGPEPSCSF